MSMGYLNRNEGYGSVNQEFVGEFPQIAGVAGNNVPPTMTFSDGYATYGNNAGVNIGNITTRPTFIINDMLTWTRNRHTLKVGMEYRKVMGNIHANSNQAGTFNFARGATGLIGVNSGSPVASFLLGAVDNGTSAFRSVDSWYPRQNAWVLHAGDTWRMNDRITLDFGLRWDYFSPSREKYNRSAFFDPIGANPGAGGRPGRLAFAGDEYGAASYGAEYPEEEWRGGFAPRLGAVYNVQRQDRVPHRLRDFLHAGVLPGLGRRHLARRLLERAHVLEQPRRHPAGVPAGAGLPAELHAAARHPLGLPQRPEHPVSAARRQRAPLLAPVEHHGRARTDARPLAERRVRRHGRAPPAVERHARSTRSTRPTCPWATRCTTSSSRDRRASTACRCRTTASWSR